MKIQSFGYIEENRVIAMLYGEKQILHMAAKVL